MKTPLRTKLLRGLCVFLLACFVVPALLGLLFGGMLVIGLEQERDSLTAPAREALEAVGLKKYAKCHYSLLTGPDTAVFHICKYDNRVDHTDLCAALMADAAATAGWTVAPVPVDEYAAQIPPEMTFLLPDANLVFDASYRQDETAAFFDDETGLMVYISPTAAPEPCIFERGGLAVPTDGRVYEIDTHGGFHGDGDEFLSFVVPEETRPSLEAALAAHADWHTGSITHAEYARLHQTFYSVPELYPSAEVTFDSWYFVDDFARRYPDWDSSRDSSDLFPAAMQEIGADRSPNWSVGFYDEDTGLFIWYEYDS